MAGAVRNVEYLSPPWRFLAEPHETYLAVVAFAAGVPVAAGSVRPASLAAQLDPWLLHAWGVSLCLGGVITLLARWRMGRAKTDAEQASAARIEVMGMVLFSTTGAMYSLALVAVGMAGLAAAPWIVGWALVCAVRARIISRQLKELSAQRQGAGDG